MKIRYRLSVSAYRSHESMPRQLTLSAVDAGVEQRVLGNSRLYRLVVRAFEDLLGLLEKRHARLQKLRFVFLHARLRESITSYR